ncbi:MAG: zinc-ribbon domain-containing protein [Thermoflexaceae bacterium]|nr:zinc-ribbon domain-containing protein [Thermoflexaceae bacterium]
MFCTKCGNEIIEGAKFCTKCGNPIGDGNAPISEKLKGTAEVGEKDYRKIIMLVTILVCVLLVTILAINKLVSNETVENVDNQSISTDEKKPSDIKSEGYNSVEAAVDALFSAAYNKDLDAVVDCFPKELNSYVQQLYTEYRSAASGMGGVSTNRALFFRYENLNPDNEYWYEIDTDSIDVLDSSEDYASRPLYYITKEQFQKEYGLTADEIYVVLVYSMGKYYATNPEPGYITTGSKGWLEVAKIGESYYIAAPDAAFLPEFCE